MSKKKFSDNPLVVATAIGLVIWAFAGAFYGLIMALDGGKRMVWDGISWIVVAPWVVFPFAVVGLVIATIVLYFAKYAKP